VEEMKPKKHRITKAQKEPWQRIISEDPNRKKKKPQRFLNRERVQ
jgi:hypothetical protein